MQGYMDSLVLRLPHIITQKIDRERLRIYITHTGFMEPLFHIEIKI